MISRARLVRLCSAALLAVLLLPALPGRAVLATSEGTTALEICGTLRAHNPASATADGSLRIGSRTYGVASGVTGGNAGVEIAVGRDLCVTASVGLASAKLVRYLFFPMLTGDRVCGNLVPSTSSDVFSMRADFGELTLVRASPSVALDDPGMRACYAYQVDRASGDLVASQKLAVRDNYSDREHVTRCGRVIAYTPASASASGQITVGSRSFRIAAGTAYTGDPAGDRTDRTTLGQAMCVVSTLDTGGAIVEYLTRPMETSITATASAYTLPTGTMPGIAILSYGSRYELRIPAPVDATIDMARSTYCFSTAVDGAGDIAAASVMACPPGTAAGGSSPSPTVAVASPSPAPPSPAPSTSPSASSVAVASPGAVARGPSEAIPLVAGGVVLLTAIALVAYVIRRRVGTSP